MSDPAAATVASASPPESAQPAQPETQSAPEDIEIDLGDGQKYKTSELKERMKRKAEWEQLSHQRYQQAAQKEKNLESALQMIKTNPAEFLRRTGIDPEEFSKAYLQDRLKHYEMTPEQRELIETKKQLEEVKKEKEKVETEKQAQVYQQEVQKFEQYFDQQFAQSMTQIGLPRNHRTIKRMAEKVELYLANDMPVDVAEIARDVKQDYIEEYGSTFQEWDDDTLGLILKDKARDRARGLLLKDVKSPIEKQQTTQSRQKFNPNSSGKKIVGLADLNKQYERINRR